MEQMVEDLDRSVSNIDIGAQESDDMLAAMAGLGDQDAFERLFIRHSKRIARLIGRFFSAPETVEDIAQEVFTKMFFALPGYKPNPDASFAAWLSRISVNACYDRLRRERRRPEDSIAAISEHEAARLHARLNHSHESRDAETEVISRDLAAKLLANLSPEDRIVLALMEIDDMPVAEIAMLTGWSKSKVKVRAHRARASLRRILSRYL
jgi:RNA polymerase sigma-70 factor (ECF subfamily)